MVRRSLSVAQAKGLSRHLHANGVSGGDENGPGGHAVLPTEEGLEGPQCIAASQHRSSAAQTITGCIKPSAGPRLVQPARPFTHCSIRHLKVFLLFSSATWSLPALFKHKSVCLILSC